MSTTCGCEHCHSHGSSGLWMPTISFVLLVIGLIGKYSGISWFTDWFDEMTRVGVSQQHALSLSGGSSKSNYRASYTFLDRNGVARDNYMTRHSFRFQFQQRAINDRLRIGLTGAATLTDMQMPFSDDYILAYNMLPVYPVYNADGSYFTDANHNYDQGNPVQNQDQNYKKAANNYFYGQGDVQFSILDGLTTKVNLYKSRFSSDYSEWQDPRNSRGQGDTGKAIRRNRLWDRNLLEWTANYTKAFGSAEEHKVDAIVGYSWENNLYADQKSEATNFAVGSMGADNIQSGNLLKIGNVTSSRNEYKLISLFARAHYSFKERYMITATVRRDGSSKFGANHKWGTFPSVSAAWGISQESFMKDTKWINDLKLRAGYGITGNQDGLRPYKSLDLYSASGTYYNNGSWPTAFRPSQNANPNLKWEQTAMLNIGLDFTLFNSRLSGTIEWYDKRTKDMLYNYEVSTPTYVYNQIQANVGDMKNTGVEILLNLDVIRNKDFTWTTSLNLTLGHAFETAFRLPHGQAVANGLFYETQIACFLKICSPDFWKKKRVVLQQNFEIIKEFDEEQIVALCQSDKKNISRKISLMLPDGRFGVRETFLNAEELNGLLKRCYLNRETTISILV